MIAAAKPLRDVTERELTAQVVELAKMLGWRRYHTWRSKHSAAGYPDETLVRDRVIFLELKTETGRVSAEQRDWLRALDQANAEVYLIRPRHLDQLAHILAARREPLGVLSTPAASAARQELRDELRKEIE